MARALRDVSLATAVQALLLLVAWRGYGRIHAAWPALRPLDLLAPVVVGTGLVGVLAVYAVDRRPVVAIATGSTASVVVEHLVVAAVLILPWRGWPVLLFAVAVGAALVAGALLGGVVVAVAALARRFRRGSDAR